MKETPQEILEKTFACGKDYEMKNAGCPQCTLAVIFEVFEIENAAICREKSPK